jgi:hypothetical protein
MPAGHVQTMQHVSAVLFAEPRKPPLCVVVEWHRRDSGACLPYEVLCFIRSAEPAECRDQPAIGRNASRTYPEGLGRCIDGALVVLEQVASHGEAVPTPAIARIVWVEPERPQVRLASLCARRRIADLAAALDAICSGAVGIARNSLFGHGEFGSEVAARRGNESHDGIRVGIVRVECERLVGRRFGQIGRRGKRPREIQQCIVEVGLG